MYFKNYKNTAAAYISIKKNQNIVKILAFYNFSLATDYREIKTKLEIKLIQF